MEYKPMTDDDFEKMLTEQRAQLEYALAIFDATAELYLIPYRMAMAKEDSDG